MSDRSARRIFVASACLLAALAVFAWGFVVGWLQIGPFRTITEATGIVHSYLTYGELVPENRVHRAPRDAPRVPFTVHEPGLRAGGHYVFVGFDGARRSYAAWLYDMDGALLHSWSIDYAALDPDGPPADHSDDPHGFHVLPDGSIVVGFDKGDVMARLDGCSRPVWIRPGIFHHAMEPAEDGSIWTWRGEGSAYGNFHDLENFDPATGEHIKGLSLVDDIIRPSAAAATLLAVTTDYPFRAYEDGRRGLDIFHPNDIEELPAALADRFPLFEAGDLMLSLRRLNLIMIIDPDDRALKWWSYGPWRAQHDPDFRADGRISVFDNNPHRNGSRILAIDPVTRKVSNPFTGTGFSFYSEYRGKHQNLPNGNVLIVVPEQGRVVEVTADGRKVVEFNNISSFGEAYNEDVENALWLEPGYFDQMPACES